MTIGSDDVSELLRNEAEHAEVSIGELWDLIKAEGRQAHDALPRQQPRHLKIEHSSIGQAFD